MLEGHAKLGKAFNAIGSMVIKAGSAIYNAGDKFECKAVVSLYRDFLSRVEKEKSPRVLPEHIKNDPDTAYEELELLSKSKEDAHRYLLADVFKTDGVLLCMRDHMEFKDKEPLFFACPDETLKDIIVVDGAFSALREMGIVKGALSMLFDDLPSDEQRKIMMIDGGLKALVVMKSDYRSEERKLKRKIDEFAQDDPEGACLMMVAKGSFGEFYMLDYDNEELKAWCDAVPDMEQRQRVADADKNGVLEDIGIDVEEWIAGGQLDINQRLAAGQRLII